MNILFSGTIEFWVPIFVLNDTSFLSWSTLPIIFILILLLLISAWLITCAIIIVYSVRKLHDNATWIFILICAGWFECMLGLILIFPYKYGILTVSDSSEAHYGYESDDTVAVELSSKCVPLIIGSFLMWHYLGLLNGGIICFVIERTFATWLACDYESKPRKWLFISLLLAHQLIAISLCFLLLFHVFSLTTWLCVNGVGFCFSVPFIFLLRQYNVYARNQLRLGTNITSHSLTAKFQTEENVRSMNIAARIAIVASLFDVVFLVVIILAIFEAPGIEIFSQITEIVLFLNPILLIPAVASCVEDWRSKFIEYLPISRIRVDPGHNPYVSHDHRETAQIYFTQLQSLWV